MKYKMHKKLEQKWKERSKIEIESLSHAIFNSWIISNNELYEIKKN